MPNYFKLHRDGSLVHLIQVDEEMSRHFGEEPHPTKWFAGWYNSIGFYLAMGRSWDEIRAIYAEDAVDGPLAIEIINWLDANFQVNSWYLPK